MPPRGSGKTAATVAVLRSEGQRMLLHVEGSLVAIANTINRQGPSVHEWRTGRKTPNAEARVLIERAFGIPRDAWLRKPGGLRAVADAAEDKQQPPPPSAAAVDALERTESATMPSSLQECLEMLAVVRRDRRDESLSSSERVKLVDAETRILSLRARLEAAAELSEDRYVREHPAWQRLQRLILQALTPHPIAAKAVREAIAAALRDEARSAG